MDVRQEYLDAVMEITEKDKWEPIQKRIDKLVEQLMVRAALYAEDWGEVKECRGQINVLLELRGMREQAKLEKTQNAL